MSKRPTYEELEGIRDRMEKQIADLENRLKSRSEPPEVFRDAGLFGELFRKAADMILMAESDLSGKPGKILLANPAALINLEYSLEEIQNLSFRDLAKDTGARAKKDPMSPESLKYESTFRTKSGKEIFSEVHSHVFVHGREKYVFSIVRNISERRRMENTLRQSEEKYKRLVESLSDEYIFYAHDTTGMITYLSPSITRVLGYSMDEAMRNFKEFLTDHEMNVAALNSSLESLKGNIQAPFMNEVYHRDGTTRIFNNTELPVYNEEGEIIGVEGIAHDITVKAAAEKELKKQQEIFNLLVDTIEEVFWIHDLKTDRLLYVSPKYREVYGRSTNSLYHNPGSFLKAVHPDDIEFVKREYRKIARGKGLDLEYRVVMPDGTEKLLWSRSFVLLDERKKASLSIGTALDISERKKTQHEKALLAAIVENVDDHAVIKDTSLRIIASNRANLKAAGVKSPDQLIGKTDLEIYGDLQHVRQYMEDDRRALEMKQGETLVNEQEFVFPDGRKIHSLVKKFPIFDERNKLIAVASISRDVTDYKNALAELYDSEEKYRLLINNQGEGIGMVDPGDRFLFANPKAEEIFDIAPGKLVGRDLFEFVDKSGKKFLEEQTERRRAGNRDTYEMEIRTESGETKQLLVTANPQYKDNEFQGTFAVFRDITHRRKVEEDLRKSERELMEVNATKDKFFAIIAHDLKNPFSSILNCSDLLLMDYSNYDKEEILTLIKMINDASRQAHNILENLLTWSRAQAGKIDYIPEAIDVQATVESIIQLYQATALEKNISLLNRVKTGTLVFGDENMVSTILRNLVSNAIKFTKPRGKVTVSTKRHRNQNEIQVIDTGIGMPEEIIERLFKIGENVIRSGTANEEGTGLGLVLCKEFAEKNKGTIKVNSKAGKGTTISVLLPRQL